MLFLHGATQRYAFYTLLLALVYYGIFLASGLLGGWYSTIVPLMLIGIALAILLLFGIPAWLGIALGSGFINLHLELLPLYNITTTAGVVVEIMIATMILRYYHFQDTLVNVRDVWIFAVVTWLIAPVFGVSITHIPILISPEISPDYVLKIWLTDWFINASSLFIITPLILVWQNFPTINAKYFWQSWLEWALLLLALIGISGIILNSSNELRPLMQCLMLPIVLWASLRFAQHGATIATLAVTIVLLNDDLPYFSTKQTNQFSSGDLLLDAGFTAITTITILILAAMWTEQRQLQRRLIRDKESVINTLHSIADAVLTTDKQGAITYLNAVAVELTGWTPEQALGKNALKIFNIKSLDDTVEILRHPIELGLQGIISPPQQCLLVNRERFEKVIETSAAPIGNPDAIEGTIVIFHDISKEHRLREQLTHQASHDALTGLCNRRELEFRLNSLINSAKATTQSHSLLYLDLDQFKAVNDTAGHLAGDALLKQLVTVIQGRVRGDDTFARLGGDEFAIILKNCPVERAGGVATSFLNTVHDFRFVWEDKTFEVGVSIGVVPINACSENIAALLSKADFACYAAKQAGRNQIYVLDDNEKITTAKLNEVHWTPHLLKALEEQRFVLYRQPIVSLQTNDSEVNYELLIRMKDEHGAIILPGSFIPAAERHNLISQIDKWVIHKVLTHLAQNPPNQKTTGFFSINLSATSLNDPNFLQFIQNELAQLTVSTQLICFELAETTVVSSLDKASYLMNQMNKLGFRFALDNFGSGFSSFGYLKQLPIDYLKIDGKFVRDMITDSVDRVIVESMHHIGHEMHLKTIAEWVEDETTRSVLQQTGIDFAQGFSIGKPEPFL